MKKVVISLTFFLMVATTTAWAIPTTWKLSTQQKKPLKNYALAFYPAKPSDAPRENVTRSLVQEGKTFVPAQLVISVGSTVVFPNKDDTAHSIYSFSNTKKFNIELYKKTDSVPTVKFDEEGVVILGCNIHDWMVGMIIVVDTPYAHFSNEEKLAVDLPPGEYRLKAWHRELGMESLVELPAVTVAPDKSTDFEVPVNTSLGGRW
jgi:plastocyanin